MKRLDTLTRQEVWERRRQKALARGEIISDNEDDVDDPLGT